MSWVIFRVEWNRHLHEHGTKLLVRDPGIIASTVAGGISQTASNESSHTKRHVVYNVFHSVDFKNNIWIIAEDNSLL